MMKLDEVDLRPFYQIFNTGVMQHYLGRPLDPETVSELVTNLVIGELESIKKSITSVERYKAEKMGVNCPGCGVEITVANAGGYRTYCEKCAEEVKG